MPQALGFSEAQGGIAKGDAGRGPQTRIGHAVGKVEEELRRTAIGTDVEQGKEAFRIEPDIFVHKRQGTKSHQHDEHTFEEFEHGDGLKHSALAAVRI